MVDHNVTVSHDCVNLVERSRHLILAWYMTDSLSHTYCVTDSLSHIYVRNVLLIHCHIHTVLLIHCHIHTHSVFHHHHQHNFLLVNDFTCTGTCHVCMCMHESFNIKMSYTV
jgi:hypothetical protein